MQNAGSEAPQDEAGVAPEDSENYLNELKDELTHKYSLLEGDHPDIKNALRELHTRPIFSATFLGKGLDRVLGLQRSLKSVMKGIAEEKAAESKQSLDQSRLKAAILSQIAQSIWVAAGAEAKRLAEGGKCPTFRLETLLEELSEGYLAGNVKKDHKMYELLSVIRETALSAQSTTRRDLGSTLEKLNELRIRMGFSPGIPLLADPHATSSPLDNDEGDMTFGQNNPENTIPVETRMPKAEKPELVHVSIDAATIDATPKLESLHTSEPAFRAIRSRVKSFGLPTALEAQELSKQHSVGPVAELSLEDAGSQEGTDSAQKSIYPVAALDQAQVFQADSGLELMQDHLSRSSGWNGMLLERLEPQEEAMKNLPDEESVLESPKQKDEAVFGPRVDSNPPVRLDIGQQPDNLYSESQRTISQTESVPGEGSVRPIPVHSQLQNPLVANTRPAAFQAVVDNMYDTMKRALRTIWIGPLLQETLQHALLTELTQLQAEASNTIDSEARRLEALTPPHPGIQMLRLLLKAIGGLVKYSNSSNWTAPEWFLVKWFFILWFLKDFLEWTVPEVSKHSLDATVDYLIHQDNILVAVVIRITIITLMKEAISNNLQPETSQAFSNMKVWHMVYLRSLIFIAAMTGFMLDMVGSNWTQIVLNSIPVEIICNLDALSQEILNRSRKIGIDTLQSCSQLDMEAVESQIQPHLELLRLDYIGLAITNTMIVFAFAIASTAASGALAYTVTLGIYLAIYYLGCSLELKQIQCAALELAQHKRYSKQTIYWRILYGAFRLNSLLIISSFFFYQESRFEFRWLCTMISLMLIMMFVRDDVLTILRELSSNRKVNTRFRDVAPDPSCSQDCTICQGRIGRPVETRCGHAFHWHCIVLWSVYHNPQCPNCRASLD